MTVPQNDNQVNEGVHLDVLIMELHKGENNSSQEHSLEEMKIMSMHLQR